MLLQITIEWIKKFINYYLKRNEIYLILQSKQILCYLKYFWKI